MRIESEVEWRDRHTVIKAAFPFNLRANYATYDMPFGAIQRPTHPQTPAEKAKWEVPGLAWADLTTESSASATETESSPYGVSILSDYKHGYSATPSELQLTLLRGPTWPDPESDQGHHSFVYAIYPHSGTWQAARTVHRSYELRHPLQGRIVLDNSMESSADTTLEAIPTKMRLEKNTVSGSFITIPSDHFVMSAIKQSEDCEHTWIARGYECHGESSTLAPENAQPNLAPSAQYSTLPLFGVSNIHEQVSILEQPLSPLTTEAREDLRPWGIHTWAIHKH